MNRDCFWMLAVLAVAAFLMLSGMSRAQEATVTVPESQLRQMLNEHAAALFTIHELELEVARLKAKQLCV